MTPSPLIARARELLEKGVPERIMQTEFGRGGNCQSACVAMMLGLPLSAVPTFSAAADDAEYRANMSAFLRSKGFYYITLRDWQPDGVFYIAGGVSKRGFMHSVIYKDGQLWHDPHPDGTGIEEVLEVDLIIPRLPRHAAAPALIDELATALEAAEAKVEELSKLVYVPGMHKCAKCGCVTISTLIHAESGKFAANNEPQQCPNGCGPMWKRTEREAGNELVDRLDAAEAERARVCNLHLKLMNDFVAVEAEKARLKEALRLALVMLDRYEPPDSRVTSDEYVAMGCVLVGQGDEACDQIIRSALASTKDG